MEMDEAQKQQIEQHLYAARKIMREALKQCQAQGVNPAAAAQVMGENALQLMIGNFGPDAGREYCKSLTEEALRMGRIHRTRQPKAD